MRSKSEEFLEVLKLNFEVKERVRVRINQLLTRGC